MAGVAGVLRDELQPLCVRVDAAVLTAVPALAEDADVRVALARSTGANLADVLALLADPGLPVDSGVPPEALALATTLVRRGVEPGDLVHAYLVGQNELWRAWMEEVGARSESGPELIGALELSSSRIFSRADFLVAQLLRHVERERERWMGGALARRAELIRALLRDGGTGVGEASRALGYDLERCVLSAVLWDGGADEDPAAPFDGLEACATALARAAGAPRALTLPSGTASMWAWVGTPERPDVEHVAATIARDLPPGRGIALGTLGSGLVGFRIGHEEALHARRVSELGDTAGVIRYDEIEALSLVSADPERLGRFVRRTLGGLAAPDEPSARLRQTLLAWLEEGGNARRAAERLHAHKNTVHYRLHRAEQILGHPLDHDRGQLELALTAVERLGPRATG